MKKLRHAFRTWVASLPSSIDTKILDFLLKTENGEAFLSSLKSSQLPLIRTSNRGYELHAFFKDFLTDKLLAVEGQERKRLPHAQLATLYEAMKNREQAVHQGEAGDWASAGRLLIAHKEDFLRSSPAFLKSAIERIPPDQFFYSDMALLHLKADLYSFNLAMGRRRRGSTWRR